MDIMPVVSLDGSPIGSGQPGPMAHRLFEALAARMGQRDPAQAMPRAS
jgi:hypothetical protein